MECIGNKNILSRWVLVKTISTWVWMILRKIETFVFIDYLSDSVPLFGNRHTRQNFWKINHVYNTAVLSKAPMCHRSEELNQISDQQKLMFHFSLYRSSEVSNISQSCNLLILVIYQFGLKFFSYPKIIAAKSKIRFGC